jgi:hypothetical protein
MHRQPAYQRSAAELRSDVVRLTRELDAVRARLGEAEAARDRATAAAREAWGFAKTMMRTGRAPDA